MDQGLNEVVGSLLTIGDELLLGDIPNGNAHYIASELRARGFRLNRMVTIGDGEDDIVELLLESLQRCDFLIVTGGLGPTDDDRTNQAVARAFQRPLVCNPEYTEWLKRHLAQYGLSWSAEAARMAELPEGALKLGLEMAGFFLEHQNIPCYFLPGVPHEMKFLLEQSVIPDLEARFPSRCAYVKEVIRVQGLYESEVSQRLRGFDAQQDGIEIGYLPQITENWVTLFVAASNEEEARVRIKAAQAHIIQRIGSRHISGLNDECLEKVIGRQLRERSWRMATAESCTGGLLSRKITAISGASEYFDRGFITYSNQSKMDLLGVPEEMLNQHGAVSEPVALAMARGACRHAHVEVAVAITGIAGPSGGSVGKPVGTVFIACATPEQSLVEKYQFSGSREHIQESAAHAALVLLWRSLTDDSLIHCH